MIVFSLIIPAVRIGEPAATVHQPNHRFAEPKNLHPPICDIFDTLKYHYVIKALG